MNKKTPDAENAALRREINAILKDLREVWLKNEKLKEEVERLRKALKFYAGDHPWRVGNKVAIDALEGE